MKLLKSLVKKTTTAGTRVALVSAKTLAYGVKIKAPSGNSGLVYLGDSTVAAASGYVLAAGEVVALDDILPLGHKGEAVDLSLIYIDSSVNAEGVCVLYLDNKLG